jgi:lysozyme family protein
MIDNFHPSLKLVLQSESGNDDDPHDHGGRTSRGITQREFDKYCAAHGENAGDVWQASDALIANIYHDDYWLPRCPDLPLGVDYVYFDTCVNAGPRQATKTLQSAVGVIIDGGFGPKTLAAAKALPPKNTILGMSAKRRAFYQGLAQFPRYGKGWLNRVNFCEKNALAMVK